MILEINAEHPQPRRIEQAVEVLRSGGLVAYPTDSVYGIGCDITSRAAIDRLHALVRDIKGDPHHSPLSFLCHSLGSIAEYALISDYAYRSMRRLLPGPYTFVLEATRHVPSVMRKKRKTLGIRVPDAPIPLALIEALGNPIATTSASWPDGGLIPDPWSIQDLYGHCVDLIIDGGYLYPEPTTVIDFTSDHPRLIREGKGPIDDLEIVEVL